MKAIVYRSYGSPAVLSLEETEPPRLGDTDVLVRVHASSLNAWDRDNVLGAFANRGMLGWRRPRVHVLGGDFAGRIEAVGRAVTRFGPGDEVLGDLCNSGWGAFAELARVPEDVLTRKPAALGFAQAAALPQAAVLALQGIRDHGALQSGQRVLISGAGGGAGSFAVQLAKLHGAEVTAVDAAPKLAALEALGADHVLDYRTVDYARTGKRYDFVLDCELHRSATSRLRALERHGKLTVVGGATWPLLQTVLLGRLLRLSNGRRADLLFHQPNKDLAYLASLAAEGRIQPLIDREYPLRELPEAMQRMCDGAVIGKAVIVIA